MTAKEFLWSKGLLSRNCNHFLIDGCTFEGKEFTVDLGELLDEYHKKKLKDK